MRDDVALKSQQFAEQVEQRRDRYSQQLQDTWMQAPNAVTRFQQAATGQLQQQQMMQEMELDKARTASTLATDQLRRQQAAEELQYATALHQTDMIAADKRIKLAQASYEEARLKKLQESLGGTEIPATGWSDEEIDNAMAQGIKGAFKGGRFVMVEATPEEVAGAKKRREERRTTRNRVTTESLGQLRRDYRDLLQDIDNGEVSDEDMPRAEALLRDMENQLRARGVEIPNRSDTARNGAPASTPEGKIKSFASKLWGDKK